MIRRKTYDAPLDRIYHSVRSGLNERVKMVVTRNSFHYFHNANIAFFRISIEADFVSFFEK
jgi:hypothetical protein